MDTFQSDSRMHMRPDGQGIYCLSYTKDMLDFDNWDFMFQTKYCCRNGLTMNQFDTPPRLVLDLGCGAGLWTIEAAKQWKGSKIIGFDFLDDIQPKLALPRDIAQRIEWVQGNFLEALPFPSGYFDLVRCARIGFHVPEDESQHMFQEIYRVMKAGGVIEIIEEDLIFPHAHLPSPYRSSPQGYPVESIDEGTLSNYSSLRSTKGSISHLSSGSSSSSSGKASSRYSSAPSASGSFSRSLNKKPSKTRPESFGSTLSQDFASHRSEHISEFDPHNHWQLQAAWERMLQKRLLTSRYTSVLSLYLQSIFADTQLHPPLQISLPPNSSARYGSSLSTLGPGGHANADIRTTPHSSNDDSSSMGQMPRRVSSWASMHLARTVRTVIGCKESMWEAWLELFGRGLSASSVTRSPLDKHFTYEPWSSGVRDAFENAWYNWESDMKDRIGIRGNIRAELMWTEPSGEAPDWRVWRDCSRASNAGSQDNFNDANLCRSMRAFVGWKPSGTKARERRK